MRGRPLCFSYGEIIMGLFALALLLLAGTAEASPSQPALANLTLLEKAGARVLARDESIGVGYAHLTEEMQRKIQHFSHEEGKCGGFEALPTGPLARAGAGELALLSARVQRDRKEQAKLFAQPLSLAKRPEIVAGLLDLKEENLRETVEWLSSYPSRYNKLKDPNQHVVALEARLKKLLGGYAAPYLVEQIEHRSTKQRTLHVRLEGRQRPGEIVVLGGHLDSLNAGWFDTAAPGADDNASGSANLIEALRVLITRGQPERTVEFFWYAGEESGLLGSAEIAKRYKQENKDVVAVLQLDMTLFPGAGEFVIGNVSDFTSPWLQQYLVALNDTYLQAKVIPDECGYACSDHASWYRQGYPTLMPFEADTERMNPRIHSAGDKINSTVSFRHSLNFAKIALVFAMDLGNSVARAP